MTRRFTATILLTLSILSLSALAEPIPSKSAGAILEELRHLKEKREHKQLEQLRAVAYATRSAAASGSDAIDYWHQCIEKVEFKSKTRNQRSPFLRWKQASRDITRDSTFRRSLQHYLRYMALSLDYCLQAHRKNPETQDEQMLRVDELKRFIVDLSQDIEEIQSHRLAIQILSEPIANSVFAERYHLEELLGKLENWEPVPINVRGIEEHSILPALRALASEQLLEFWDFKIQRERAWVTAGVHDLGREDFFTSRLPWLLWMQAEDMRLLGKDEEAVERMLEILKTYPRLSNFDIWLEKLESYLQESAEKKEPSP